MSWVFGYLALGAVWAEIGKIGHVRKYKEEVTVSFYLFMLLAWPWGFGCWVKEMFK